MSLNDANSVGNSLGDGAGSLPCIHTAAEVLTSAVCPAVRLPNTASTAAMQCLARSSPCCIFPNGFADSCYTSSIAVLEDFTCCTMGCHLPAWGAKTAALCDRAGMQCIP